MKFDRILKHYDRLNTGHESISDLKDHKILFNQFVRHVLEEEEKPSPKYLELIKKFLTLCNDYYAYSEDGDVLITDHQYDEVTNVYKRLSGESQVIYTDSVNLTRWNEMRHVAPNMVGSLEKVYDLDEMWDRMFHDYGNLTSVTLSPKFDGCSIVITFDNKLNIVAALTRKDGVYGQDLLPLVKEVDKCGRLDFVRRRVAEMGCYDYIDAKCEILVHENDYRELFKIKPYKNRRAAASAISANPSNIKYAQYLSFKPLVGYGRSTDGVLGVKEILCSDTIEIKPRFDKSVSFKEIVNDYVHHIKNDVILKGYRTDGVVFTFSGTVPMDYSKDIMADSLAYKFNTQMGETTIESCYLSIGRTGKATPMIKVSPCDVNETEVTDVSLSNFKKCNKLDLHIGDTIIIESAGDVIPMIKEVVFRDRTKPNLSFDDRCPHCGNRLQIRRKFDQMKGESSNDFDLYCSNPECNRIIAGRLTNFLDKLGAKGISDGVMSSVVELTGVKRFYQLFNLEAGCLARYEGWGAQSEADFLKEVSRIQTESHPYSTFLGAIGIPMVSKEKCKLIMANINYDKLMNTALKDTETCREMLMSVEGIGSKLAKNIADYLLINWDEIMKTSDVMSCYQDTISFSKGNVVFSGFRDEDLVHDIEELGYKYSDNITKDTVAVITTSLSSGKAKKARNKGISMYFDTDRDELLKDLRNL